MTTTSTCDPVPSTAFGYPAVGGVEVLRASRRVARAPGVNEVRIRLARSGVNPTDVKSRRGALHMPIPEGEIQVPHHDGAGTILAVGDGVEDLAPGQRVWTYLAAYRRLDGTAQEAITLDRSRVAPLPDDASFELGAALGVPFLTAHRLLTLRETGPRELRAGALDGVAVLVAGGAGAVGNAAIQLAAWAGATVLTTVSSPAKATLARAAGAHHVIDYRAEDVVARVRAIVPDGVDVVVEVSPAVNLPIDLQVLATGGALAVYAGDGGAELTLPVQELMWLNLQIGFVILYTLHQDHLAAAVRAVGAALVARALGVGAEHGMPILSFPLHRIAAAHAEVESGPLGKVQLDLEPVAADL
jgi:NADPH:quinone reductase